MPPSSAPAPDPRPRAVTAPLGAGLVVTAALLWAAIGPLATPLLDRGWDATQVAAWRALVGAVAFGTHATVRGAWPRRSVPLLAAFGVVGVGVFYVALPAAIDTGGLTLAWLLLYTAPAWVALAAPRVLGEATDARTAGLVVATVAGIACVAIGGGEGLVVTPASLGWGLLAGGTYATWYLVAQRAGTPPVATAAVALPVGATVLLPFLRLPVDAVEWALVLGLGLAATYLPALAYWHGLRHVTAARGAVLATIEPVAAVAVAAVVFGERPTGLAVLGGAVVLAAAVAAAMSSRSVAPAAPTG